MHAGRIVRGAMGLVIVAGCATAAPVSPPTQRQTPGATETPGATATARPTDVGVLGARRVPGGGEIESGTYFVPMGPWTPATFSFTMPAGWTAQNNGQTISKHPDESGREVGWSVSIVDRLFAEPCGADDTIEVGRTADDLVAALLALPGPQAGAPMDITIGGRSGTRLDLTVPADLDVEACDPPIGLQIWLDKSGTKYLVIGHELTSRVYTVDVDGGRFVLVAHPHPTAAPADITELEAIIESIRFEP